MNLEYYFNVLQMPITYDIELINKKYRELIKACHPDIHHDADSETKAIEINIAYHEIKKYINEQISNEKKGVSSNNDINSNGTYEENDVQNIKIENFIEEIIRDLKVLCLSTRLAVIKYKKFCIKAKEEYEYFIEFKDWLKLEIYKEKLIKNIGLTEPDLRKKYDKYCLLVKKEKQIPYTFINWLEIKLREKNAIKNLNSNRETCIKEYEIYRKNVSLNNHTPLFFVDWLESKELELNMLNSLNMTYDIALNQYNSYCLYAVQNGYTFYTFTKWLEIIYNRQIKTYKKKV